MLSERLKLMTRLSRILLPAGLLTTCIYMSAQRVSTIRRPLKVRPEAYSSSLRSDNETIYGDTVAAPIKFLSFCGYEKSLRSSKETLFISNNSDSTVTAVIFTISYIDTSARKIHTRKVRHNGEIPPRETRRIDIPSWDTQKTYYYLKGETPRKSATPYDITIDADSVLINTTSHASD